MESTGALTHEEDTFRGAGDLEIYHQSWRPKAKPRGLVVLAHGGAEHSGRYAWTAERLAARGYSVDALDHRGHGRSEGTRAMVESIDAATDDLDQLVTLVRRREPDAPLFLLGHSMGGAIALAYTAKHEDRLDGLLLSAPLAALEAASPPVRLAARLLSAITPKLGLYAVAASGVSRDPAIVAEYEQDPLNHHGKLPARTIWELSKAIDRFPDEVTRFRLPLLAMHGTADTLTPIAGSEMVVERAGSADKTLTRYEGLYHELLNEPEREQVLAEIVAWLDAHS